MSDIISFLPNYVSNQIAAGEVIQRPSSVVKELLENAIDAKATSIKLIIKESGKNLIRVIDNGVGMSKNDSKIAFKRYATSKIHTFKDIFFIKTKGFRGEALASIAAISHIELKTKQKSDEIGTQIILEGGEMILENPIYCSNGSIFSIKNLFYNTPVRRKFLKSNTIEFKYILEEFISITLAHSDIKFELFHNDKKIFCLNSSDLIIRITEIYGYEIKKNLLPINYESQEINITGFISKIEYVKKKKEQYLFVNKRFFKNNYFNKSIINGYEGLLSFNQNPIFFIFFQVNSQKIDINIHPNKKKINFEDELLIFKILTQIIKEKLGLYSIDNIQDYNNNILFINNNKEKKDNKILFENKLNKKLNNDSVLYNIQNESKEIIDKSTIFTFNPVHLFRLKNNYWILDELKSVFLLDMYRIHQTVLYESLSKKNNKNIPQKLIFPLKYHVTKSEFLIFESIKKLLFQFGFEIKLTENIIYFNSLPSYFIKDQFYIFFNQLIFNINENIGNNFSKFYFKIFAKVVAKKKHQFVSYEETYLVIKKFKKIKMPKYNPFGNKNYTIISF